MSKQESTSKRYTNVSTDDLKVHNNGLLCYRSTSSFSQRRVRRETIFVSSERVIGKV